MDVKVLKGHLGVVRAIAQVWLPTSPSDSKLVPFLVSGGDDTRILLHNLRTGKISHIFCSGPTTLQKGITRLVQLDRHHVAAGSADGLVTIWQVAVNNPSASAAEIRAFRPKMVHLVTLRSATETPVVSLSSSFKSSSSTDTTDAHFAVSWGDGRVELFLFGVSPPGSGGGVSVESLVLQESGSEDCCHASCFIQSRDSSKLTLVLLSRFAIFAWIVELEEKKPLRERVLAIEDAVHTDRELGLFLVPVSDDRFVTSVGASVQVRSLQTCRALGHLTVVLDEAETSPDDDTEDVEDDLFRFFVSGVSDSEGGGGGGGGSQVIVGNVHRHNVAIRIDLGTNELEILDARPDVRWAIPAEGLFPWSKCSLPEKRVGSRTGTPLAIGAGSAVLVVPPVDVLDEPMEEDEEEVYERQIYEFLAPKVQINVVEEGGESESEPAVMASFQVYRSLLYADQPSSSSSEESLTVTLPAQSFKTREQDGMLSSILSSLFAPVVASLALPDSPELVYDVALFLENLAVAVPETEFSSKMRLIGVCDEIETGTLDVEEAIHLAELLHVGREGGQTRTSGLDFTSALSVAVSNYLLGEEDVPEHPFASVTTPSSLRVFPGFEKIPLPENFEEIGMSISGAIDVILQKLFSSRRHATLKIIGRDEGVVQMVHSELFFARSQYGKHLVDYRRRFVVESLRRNVLKLPFDERGLVAFIEFVYNRTITSEWSPTVLFRLLNFALRFGEVDLVRLLAGMLKDVQRVGGVFDEVVGLLESCNDPLLRRVFIYTFCEGKEEEDKLKIRSDTQAAVGSAALAFQEDLQRDVESQIAVATLETLASKLLTIGESLVTSSSEGRSPLLSVLRMCVGLVVPSMLSPKLKDQLLQLGVPQRMIAQQHLDRKLRLRRKHLTKLQREETFMRVWDRIFVREVYFLEPGAGGEDDDDSSSDEEDSTDEEEGEL